MIVNTLNYTYVITIDKIPIYQERKRKKGEKRNPKRAYKYIHIWWGRFSLDVKKLLK